MPIIRTVLASLAAVLALGILPAAAAPAAAGDQAKAHQGDWPADAQTGFQKNVHVEVMKEHPRALFHLSVPKDYTPEKAWPLFILLHGSNADAGNMVPFFRRGLEEKGVISVYPQSLTKQMLAWNYPHEMANMIQIIRQLGKTYRIDDRRIYLAGHSMGGGGAWCQGAVLRDLWAGIGPLSGWYAATPRPDARRYLGLPIYFIHGAKDKNVPVQLSRMADADLKKLGHKDYVYVELEKAGHGVFDPWKTVGAPELGKMVAWLLAHKRPAPANLAAATASLAAWGKQFGWTPTGTPVGAYRE